MKKNYTFSFSGIASAVLIVGIFYIAYIIDKDNKEYCIQSEGSIVVYDRDIIFDDWVCKNN